MLPLLLLIHPEHGIEAITGLELTEAQDRAISFAKRYHPSEFLVADWFGSAWWVTIDDGSKMLVPRPWPVAGILNMETLPMLYGEETKHLLLSTSDPMSFEIKACRTRIEARRDMLHRLEKYNGQGVETPYGGLTFIAQFPNATEPAKVGFLVTIPENQG